MPTETARAAEASPGFWAEAWHRFRQRKLCMLALAFVVFLCIVALFAPAIAGTKPIVCKYKGSIYFPCMGYFKRTWENPIFCNDRFRGHYAKNLKEKDPDSWAIWPLVYQDPYRRVRDDEWPASRGIRPAPRASRVAAIGSAPIRKASTSSPRWCTARRSRSSVGFVSMGIAAAIGITLGALAGYFGGWVDMLISRLIEVVMCIPSLVLILALVAMLDEVNNFHLMAIVGITSWTGIARLARAEIHEAQGNGICDCRPGDRRRPISNHVSTCAAQRARAGAGADHLRHRDAILIESGLSYLGFGASPPNPSWGTLLNSGRIAIQQMWWLIVFPGAAIFLTVLAYNLIGEGLQEVTDPRLRQPGH